MRATVILVAVLLAGCVSPPGSPTDPTASDPAVADDAPSIFMSRCAELDYYYPVDASKYDTGGLRAKRVDAAGRFANEVINAIQCANATAANGSIGPAMGWFTMVSVEPHPTLRFPNITAYVWIDQLLSPDPLLRDFFAPRIVAKPAGMSLSFTDAAGMPKARGQLVVAPQGAPQIKASSDMVGQPAPGKAGSMGAYTGNTARGLDLYRIDFSDYRAYSSGTAVISHGPLGPVGQLLGEPVPAYHNMDYDVRFTRLGSLPT